MCAHGSLCGVCMRGRRVLCSLHSFCSLHPHWEMGEESFDLTTNQGCVWKKRKEVGFREDICLWRGVWDLVYGWSFFRASDAKNTKERP